MTKTSTALLLAALLSSPALAAPPLPEPPDEAAPPWALVADEAPAAAPQTQTQTQVTAVEASLVQAHQTLEAGKGGQPSDPQAVKRSVEEALRHLDEALQQLQKDHPADTAQQAIRNARLEMQDTKVAVQQIEPDAPEAAMQALKDMQQALAEVRTTTGLPVVDPQQAEQAAR